MRLFRKVGGCMQKYSSVYVRNQYEGASCYYRIIQYLDKIDEFFIINNAMSRKAFRRNLDFKNPKLKKILQGYYYLLMMFKTTFFLIRDIILQPHCIIIQRTTLPRYTPLFIAKLLEYVVRNNTVFWDFDDDIFSNGEISTRQSDILLKFSDKIIITSEYLKDRIPMIYRDKVILIPTTDGDFRDIDKVSVYENRKRTFEANINLVWVATHTNIPNIEKLIPTLDSCAEILLNRDGKQLTLFVVCNQQLNVETHYLKVENILWTRNIAQEMILKSHIGIMPLEYSKYSLGKGGFKLIQYLATGLPVIASNVGFNTNVINDRCGILVNDIDNVGAWKDAIENIIISWEDWSSYSTAAYLQWDNKFSFENNLHVWRNLISNEYIEE